MLVPTARLLAPSLHPNTLTDITFPIQQGSEPIVQHLPIKYGTHQPLEIIKRISNVSEDQVVVADTAFRVSTLSLSETASPIVTSQEGIKHKAGDTWAGLVPLQGGILSGLSSGTVALHPIPVTGEGGSLGTSHTASLPSPLHCMASSSSSSTTFAVAGKEVEVSIWETERVFSASSSIAPAQNGKRKKNDLGHGEVWRAKNLPNDSLSLRPPVHHLSLSYLHGSSTDLVSGTKSGSVRRFDTRQRKPVADWKVAREGGVGYVASGYEEHELFFSDRANLLGSLDLRTGRILYTFPSNATATHILPIPPVSKFSPTGSSNTSLNPGMASIGSDATLRLYHTTPPPKEEVKGSWGKEGKKGSVIGMAGGVGVGSFVWRGWSEVEVPDEKQRRKKVEGGLENGAEDEDEDDEEESDEEDVWEGLGELGDDDAEEDSDDEEQSTKRKKR